MKIAIIGGSGFIGTRLAHRLQKKNMDFVILDKVVSKAYPNKYIKCDVTSINELRSSLNGIDIIVNLSAEHKDNIQPESLYFDVNVQGQKNICQVSDELNIHRHIFTSSVAVYGFVEADTDEAGLYNPFHAYGKSKLDAESVLNEWFTDGKQHSVIRPTVVFGEGNRGNVYNLLRQIASGKFLMIGKGQNSKSMAYVENIAAFIEHLIVKGEGHQVFNYVDKPDFTMMELQDRVNSILGRSALPIRIPYFIGLLIGSIFDFLSKLLRREFPISRLRVQKFCSQTQFSSTAIKSTDFVPPVDLSDGLEATIKHEFTN